MYTPVDPAIKEKIIHLFGQGLGRNQIDRLLKEQNIRVSHGSISNVIKVYKAKHDQSIQEESSQSPQSSGAQLTTEDASISAGIHMNKIDGSPALIASSSGTRLASETSNVWEQSNLSSKSDKRVTTFTTETSAETEFKDRKDVDIKNYVIGVNPTDFEKNGYASEDGQGQDHRGGPLSWFTSLINVNNNDYNNNNSNNCVIEENEEIKEKERIDKPQFLTSTSQNKRPPIKITEDDPHPGIPREDVREDDPPTLGNWDPDSDEAWDRKFFRRVFDEKKEQQKQSQLLEQQQAALNQQRQELEAEKEEIAQWNNDLRVREAKIAEVQLLIPLARQFQLLKVDVGNFMPWIETVQDYAINHNTDLTTAAFDIMNYLRTWKNLQAIINQAEQKLSTLGKTIRQNQQAIATIKRLQQTGYSKKDIAKLAGMVSIWNKSGGHNNDKTFKQLDTDLGPDNGQKLSHNMGMDQNEQGNGNNGNPSPANNSDNNGYSGGNFTMASFLKLQMLKGSTTKMLNRIG